MKLYRYNANSRKDRKFNTTGAEKNPLAVKFYAKSLEYADKYREILKEDGEVRYECALEVATVSDDLPLFDMNANFASLNTYKAYMAATIGPMVADYTRFMEEANKKSEKKMWARHIENAEAGEIERLRRFDFQFLSDYDYQISLVAELRALGYAGYTTAREVAIF